MIEKINSTINDFALSISTELSEIRFWEVERIKAVIATRMKLAMINCVEIQSYAFEDERHQLAKEYNSPGIPSGRLEQLKRKLIEVNRRLKETNRLRSELQDDSELRIFNAWMHNNGYTDILEKYRETNPKRKSIRETIKKINYTQKD